MKWILFVLLTALVMGCKKTDCKFVTVTVINTCVNPVEYHKTIDHQEMCGDDLVRVRKQAGRQTVNAGFGSTCEVITTVSEQ